MQTAPEDRKIASFPKHLLLNHALIQQNHYTLDGSKEGQQELKVM